MRLIQLDILNLASLDRPTGESIRFDEGALGNSTIFSIVGPTGSGKSTILDAICLALYNRAPRYPHKKRDQDKIVIYGTKSTEEANRPSPADGSNILTKGRKDGYSKLTFLANNGILYRAEWHIHFKNKRYDTPETLLFKLTGSSSDRTEEQVNWEEIPQIIGLGYDQFLRTVLIAQGSFASFLNANEEERYSLLEKLVGCEEMYVRITSEIKKKREEAVADYKAIETSFSVIKDDLISDPETLAELTAQIRQLEAEDQQIKENLIKVNEALKWFDQENTFAENINKLQAQLNQALLAMEASKEDFEQLSLHDLTLPAVALYEDMDDCVRDIRHLTESQKSLEQDSQQQEENIKQHDLQLADLKKIETAAKEAFDKQKPHIDKARTIKVELDACRKSLAEKEKLYKECGNALQKAVNDLNANLTAIRKVEKPELVGQTSSQLQAAKDQATQTLVDLREAIRIRHRLDETLAGKDKAEKDLIQLSERSRKIEEQLSGLTIVALQSEVKTLQNSYALLTSQNLTHCRQQLLDGEPCPVCGATHHPYQNASEFNPVVDSMRELLQEKEILLQKQTTQQQQLIKEQGEAKGRMKELDSQLAQYLSAIEGLQKEWESLIAVHSDWSVTEEYLRSMEEPAKTAVSTATSLLEDFIVLETERGKTSNLSVQKKEREEAHLQATIAQQNARDDVKGKAEALKAEIGDQDPDQLETLLNDAWKNAESAVKAKVEMIGKLREKLEGVKGSLKTTLDGIRLKQEAHDKYQKSLNQWLSEYNNQHDVPLSIEVVARLYSSEINWESIRKNQQALVAAHTSAQAMLTNEKSSHEQHQSQKPTEDKENLLGQKAKLENHSNAELVEKKIRMNRHLSALEKAGAMQEEMLAKSLKKTEWEEISEAIGGDGKTLRKIAQCYTLRFLVEHANAEIRKFNSRYELVQVKNSLGLRVIDHDRADDIRDTTSLSGGETFIVSLGLALGLSALSSRNISFENLFIDEGFGTLDPDTLSTVIDSLAMLQMSQGKKVGVISHTDTMSERISTQIRIIKNGSSGSSHIEIFPPVA